MYAIRSYYGKWTGISALDLGVPVTLIGEAVFMRSLSAMKKERVKASELLSGPEMKIRPENVAGFIDDLEQASYNFV